MNNRIVQFFHCQRCIEEKPAGVSPREWAQLEVGFTREGLQVWCKRHECNVVALDFRGQKVGIATERPADAQTAHNAPPRTH